MDSNDLLDRLRHVVVVNSLRAAQELGLALRKRPLDVQRTHFGGGPKVGFFYLYADKVRPSEVMETVVSETGDGITSVYLKHQIFGGIGELCRAREELIAAVSQKVGLSPELIGVGDPGRGRTVGLTELATGQLIDILAERMGTTVIASSSSVGGDVDVVKVSA